jgi:GT2 family glycosyltransferase
MNASPECAIDLSICIVTYKARKQLRECLDSLRASQSAELACEIIVVDNFSDDGTLEMLQREYHEVRVICLSENQGYTRPMNLALRQARGTFLLQLNPDTIILPGVLQHLYRYMENHPECGICTPKVLNRDGSMQWQCRRSEARPWDVITYFTRLSRLYPKDPKLAGYLMTYRDPDSTYEVQAVSGACMFIRRAVVAQVGYLDERYYAYQEDTDYCLRARRAGWKITYVSTAQIIHYGAEGGTRIHPYHSAFEWHRSYYLYYSRWFAKDYFFLLNWLFYGLMGIKLVFAMLKIFFSREKYPGTRKP